jgi:hypothetical protein
MALSTHSRKKLFGSLLVHVEWAFWLMPVTSAFLYDETRGYLWQLVGFISSVRRRTGCNFLDLYRRPEWKFNLGITCVACVHLFSQILPKNTNRGGFCSCWAANLELVELLVSNNCWTFLQIKTSGFVFN